MYIHVVSELFKFCYLSESESGKRVIKQWKELQHRQPDWVEADIVKRHVIGQENDEDESAFIYEDQPYLRAYR